MANDRVFIRCDGCGSWTMLMKYNGAFLCTWNEKVLGWLDDHGWCHPECGSVTLSKPGFSLHTEDAIPSELDPSKQNAGPP